MIIIILNLSMRVKNILINLHMPLFPKRNRLFSYPKYEGRGATACVTACLKAVFKLLWWIRGHSYLENPPLWQIWKEKIIWNTFIVRNWIFISFYILVNDTKMVWNIFFFKSWKILTRASRVLVRVSAVPRWRGPPWLQFSSSKDFHPYTSSVHE